MINLIPKLKGFSLWLMPTGEVHQRIYSLIVHLSKKYKTPAFKPHVTLIGEVQGDEELIIRKTTTLASFIKPCKIELTTGGYCNDYFKCLFLRVRETDEVMKANREARKIFGREVRSRYTPHLSVLYGHLSHKMNEQLIVEIVKGLPASFEINSIHVFSIRGQIKDWYRVKELPLNFSKTTN